MASNEAYFLFKDIIKIQTNPQTIFSWIKLLHVRQLADYKLYKDCLLYRVLWGVVPSHCINETHDKVASQKGTETHCDNASQKGNDPSETPCPKGQGIAKRSFTRKR